jgi:hypothetical protein
MCVKDIKKNGIAPKISMPACSWPLSRSKLDISGMLSHSICASCVHEDSTSQGNNVRKQIKNFITQLNPFPKFPEM